jgi:hypothetical protein
MRAYNVECRSGNEGKSNRSLNGTEDDTDHAIRKDVALLCPVRVRNWCDVTLSVTLNLRPIAAQLPQNFHTSPSTPLTSSIFLVLSR